MTEYIPLVDFIVEADGRRYWVGEVVGLNPATTCRIICDLERRLGCIVHGNMMSRLFTMTAEEQQQVMEAFRRWVPGQALAIGDTEFHLAQARPLRIRVVATDGYYLGAGPGVYMRQEAES